MASENEDLRQIMYISSATEDLKEETLMRLLEDSRKRNAERGITGLMLYADGNIVHVIEGPSETVQALFEKIKKDPRHTGMQLLWSKPVRKRDFPDYKMGFRRTRSDVLDRNIPGFTAIIEEGNLPPDMLDTVSKKVAIFLRSFARTTRINT